MTEAREERSPLDERLERGMSSAFRRPLPEGAGIESSPDAAGTYEHGLREPTIPDRIGRHPVQGLVGVGGMALILRGLDPDMGRELAIKVLREEYANDPDLARLVLAEARLCGSMRHPGVVPVHELGHSEDGRPYFTMRLVDGRTLQELLAEREEGAANRSKLLGIFEKICQTLAYAHTRGIVHRDLKPANIMVGAFGEVQIMDWGLARTASVEDQDPDLMFFNGRAIGTPAYMPPEQARGELDQADSRSDVFALGAVLCEILTGAPPYVADSQTAVFLKASKAWLDDAKERLRSCNADHELVELALRCLASEQEHRPRDASEVAASVAAYTVRVEQRLRDSELRAVRANARAAWERRVRRLSVALVLSIAAGVGVWLWFEADRREAASATRDAVAEALGRAQALRNSAREAAIGNTAPHEAAEAAAVQAVTLARTRGATGAARVKAENLLTTVRTQLAAARRLREVVGLLDRMVHDLDEGANAEELAQGYLDAFALCRIKPFEHDAEVVATRIRESPIRDMLVRALDTWALVNRTPGILDRQRARKLFDVAARVDPDSWRTALRNAAAVGDLEHLRELAETDQLGRVPVESLNLLGNALLLAGDTDRAIGVFRVAVRNHPGSYASVHALMCVLSESTHPPHDELIWLGTILVALRPESAHAHCDLGRAYLDAGLTDDALRQTTRALELDDGDARAWFSKGLVHRARSNHEVAIPALREALDRTGSSRGVMMVYLVDSLYAAGRRAEALDLLGDAATAMADCLSHDAHGVLAKLYKNLGFPERGAAAARTALRRSELDPLAWWLLGSCLRQMGSLEKAEAALRRSLDLDPERRRYRCELGSVLVQRGRFSEGLEQMRLAHPLAEETTPARCRQRARQAEVLVSQQSALDLLSAGQPAPADGASCARIAWAAALKGMDEIACELFVRAFEDEPGLAASRVPPYRYLAARSAARLSGGSEGERFSRQALGWLRAELAEWEHRWDRGRVREPTLRRTLAEWLHEPAFSGLLTRGPNADAWLALRRSVDDLRRSVDLD